jgi:hypothetical protein
VGRAAGERAELAVEVVWRFEGVECVKITADS